MPQSHATRQAESQQLTQSVGVQVTRKRLSGFQLPEADVRALDRRLGSQARALVQQLARTASSTAGVRMNQRCALQA